MRIVRFLASILAVATFSVRPAAQSEALFDFHSNPWLNLHHILWAKGEGAPLPTDMPEAERKEWLAGIEAYAPWSKTDLFNDELVKAKLALRASEAKATLEGVSFDAGIKATLERLMPLYRKHWWDAHDRANRDWTAAARKLVDRHGMAINDELARVYDVKPENPVWVDVSVRAGRVGAYTTMPPAHVMISSTDPGYAGYKALEMLFHERSHPLGGRMLFEGVRDAAEAQGIKVPPQLSHGVLFYIAGELTARELKTHGIAYAHYSHGGLYDILCGKGCGEKLAAHWGPYLDGKRSRAEAFAGLVASFK